jgi:long-subunit fatty acid transport protein
MRNYYKASIYPDIEFDYGKKNTPVSTPESAYTDYRYQTPYSWVFSAAGIIGTHAIVSVDYEVKDYQSMNLKDQYAYNYVDINNDMNDNSKMASTLRAGFEYRFTSQFSGRLGYSWMQNPYEKTFKDNQKEVIAVGTIPHYVIEGDVNYLTAGIGYRFSPDFYLDFALVQRSQKNDLYFFPFMNSKRHGFEDQYPVAASFKNISYKGLVTLGFKF